MTGQNDFVGINTARTRIGRERLLEPPEPYVFPPSPVGQLVIQHGPDGVRLLLPVTRPVTEDIMVFGQAPCSAGRMKRRNVAYLSLLSVAQDGIGNGDHMRLACAAPRPAEQHPTTN